VRFDGAPVVAGGGAGLDVDGLVVPGLDEGDVGLAVVVGLGEVEFEGEVEVGFDVVDDEGLEVVGVVELLFDADFDPPLEHAADSSPAAAISARPVPRRVRARARIRRLLRTPASAMTSTLAATCPPRQPVGPSRSRL
jgi:hypothetical protein